MSANPRRLTAFRSVHSTFADTERFATRTNESAEPPVPSFERYAGNVAEHAKPIPQARRPHHGGASLCGSERGASLAHWIPRAPGFRVVRSVAQILADEARHAFLLYRVLDSLGVSQEEAVAIAEGKSGSGSSKSQSLEGPLAVTAPENEWIDVVLNCMFLDRAGRLMVGNFAQSSFAPWATACKAILKDEDMHVGFGLTGFRRFLKEEKNREKLSRQVTRWYAYGLNFFGPPASSKDQALFDFGLKRKSNELLRRDYIEEVAEVLAGPGQDLHPALDELVSVPLSEDRAMSDGSSRAGAGPSLIIQLMQGAQATAIITAAIDLNVFQSLADGPLTANATAERIGCPARTTRILLDALTVQGLLAKDGDDFGLTPVASEHLVPGKPTYIGDMRGIYGSDVMWTALPRLAASVRRGGSAAMPEHSFWEQFAQSGWATAVPGATAIDLVLGAWVGREDALPRAGHRRRKRHLRLHPRKARQRRADLPRLAACPREGARLGGAARGGRTARQVPSGRSLRGRIRRRLRPDPGQSNLSPLRLGDVREAHPENRAGACARRPHRRAGHRLRGVPREEPRCGDVRGDDARPDAERSDVDAGRFFPMVRRRGANGAERPPELRAEKLARGRKEVTARSLKTVR